MKELTPQILSMYIGIDVYWKDPEDNEEYTVPLAVVHYDGDEIEDHDGKFYSINDVKPILRPLSSVTEEEIYELAAHMNWGIFVARDFCKGFFNYSLYTHEVAKAILWLLSKSFDLFGLIDAGLAIIKTDA